MVHVSIVISALAIAAMAAIAAPQPAGALALRGGQNSSTGRTPDFKTAARTAATAAGAAAKAVTA